MTRLVGMPIDRVDGIPKVTGKALYAADESRSGLLHAMALRSAIASGRVAELNVSDAEATTGVVSVFTYANAPRLLNWEAREDLIALGAEGLGLSAFDLSEDRHRRPAYLPLTSDIINFAGQWLAIVVAETIEAARQAIARIKVRYTETPASTIFNEREDWLSPTFFFGADMQHERGACTERPGKTVVQACYSTSMQLHQPLEPSATLAYWEGKVVTLVDSTQGVIATRDYVSCSLKVPKENVRVISNYVGGGFGGKNQVWPHQALAAHISRHLRRPIRIQLTRADMAVASGHRSSTEQHVYLSAHPDGRIALLRHVSCVPTSFHGGFFEPCGLNTLMLYDAESVDVRHHVVRKNIPTPTPFRAPGEAPGSFALESALDELADTLKMDPVAFRSRNFASEDRYSGREWSSNNLLECYRIAAQGFGWPGRYIPTRSVQDGNELIGYGMAATAYPASAVSAGVRVRLHVGGRATIETSATDIGTGMYTILGQTVGEELDLPLESITVRLGDSTFPAAPTAGRSRSTASVLPAARKAARAVLKQLDELRSIFPPQAASNDSMFSLMERAGLSELVAEDVSSGTSEEQKYSFHSFGAHFVEVRVDEQLGRVRVTRVVSAFDCGRIINPKTATSQIKGGIAFGIGMALMEEGEFDPVQSRLVNDNLADYRIPVHADIPDPIVLFVEKPDLRLNPLGARGLGEIAVPGMAAAITNAVFRATGRRVRHLPIRASDLVNIDLE